MEHIPFYSMAHNNNISKTAVCKAIRQVRNTVLPNADLTYKLLDKGSNVWHLKITSPLGPNSAKVELIIDEFDDPEDRGVRGFVYHLGDVPRDQITLVMDSIMEKL
jgi:hypothetical protein